MKRILEYLVFAVLLLQGGVAYAQGELWGADYMGSAIFKIDGTSPAAANYVQKHKLTPTSNGVGPSGLVQYSNGKLYGTTQGGGSSNVGVLFEYDPGTGIYTKKVDFMGINGSRGGALTLAANGKLYGTTFNGGASGFGVLFEYDPATNTYTKKFDFDGTANGRTPVGTLTPAANGKLYGLTSQGGAFGGPFGLGLGVLFEYDPATSTYTKRVDFSGTATGSRPISGLLAQGTNGKLYGATFEGGASNTGVLFEFDPSTNVFTKKIDFSSGATGAQPTSGVTLAGNGRLYGTTFTGGANSYGVLFEYDYVTNSYTVKHDFLPDDAGAEVYGLTLAGNGKLYGVTSSGGGPGDNGTGALFEYDPTASTFTTKMQFNYPTYDPVHPQGVSSRLLYAQTQTITGFAAIPNKTYGDAPFTVSATGGVSGNPVTFISSNPAVATVSGNTVTIVGGGTVTITAYQAGTTTYLAAGATQTFTVNQASQTITFATLADKTVGDAPFALTGTASSGLPITYTSSNTAVATTSGNTVTIIGAGTTIITASQPGNASYLAATDVQQTLTVKLPQSISLSGLPVKTMGDAPFVLSATGGASGNPVTFISSNTAVATVLGNVVTIVGAGTTTITASQAGNAGYSAAPDVSQSLTVNKGDQAITFGALSSKTFGDAPFTLTGTASSGLALSYVSSNTSVATVSGSTVTIVGAGSTTITASQAGNASFDAATDVPETLTVNKASQSIVFGVIPVKAVGDADFTLSAASTSGLAVSYASSNMAVATVSGNTVTIVGGGTTTITASQAGNTNYDAATDVQQTLVVGTGSSKTEQTITFNTLADKVVGDAAFTLTGTASSGLTVTYSSSNPAVATVSGNTVTVVGAGTAIITATQSGNASFNTATPVTQILTVNKANQTITFNTLTDRTVGDAAFDLTATASSSLAVSYASSNTSVATVSGGTVTIVGAGTTIITASQPGNASYNAATSVTRTLTINKSNQTITFNTLPDRNVGDAAFSLSATASSGLTVSYTSSSTAVATISGSTLTIVGIGTAIITASQTGNGSYNAATPVSRTLTVNKTNQTITFNTLADKIVGDANFNLTATASSSLAVSYSSSNTAVATVLGNVVTIVGAGTTTITASQAGNANYNAANSVSQTLTVNKADQVVTFSALGAKTYGDAPFTLGGTASSGLEVSYVSSNTSVAMISGGMLIIVGAGSTTITASQTGNANFNAATGVTQTLTVNKANQVITFSPLPEKAVGDEPFNLTATASSGLPVTYLNGNSAVATLLGSTVTIVGVGTTAFLARQSGNSNYNAATPVTQGLTVKRLNQSITFNPLPPKNVGDEPFELTATASSGLPVSYISSNTSVATISGSTMTIVGGGSATINAIQGGNDTYNPAIVVALPLIVNKLNQAISFVPQPSKTVGDAPFNLTATANSGLPVTYSSNNPSVATVSGNTVSIVGAGTATITATQAGDASYNSATPVARFLTVDKLNQVITFSDLSSKTVGDAAFDLAATTNSGLPVSFTSSNPSVATVSGSTVTIVGGGSTIITALQPGNASYNAAISATQMLTVNKTNQMVTFSALADKEIGDADFNLTASASSSLAVSYESSNPSVATVTGSTVTIVGAGATNITASQVGNSSYNAAIPVTQTLTVNKSNQAIAFSALADRSVGDPTFNLSATTTSGLTVSYASSNTAVATVGGNIVTVVGAGTTIITASQAGNGNFNAATPASQTLTVNKSNQAITFNTLADKNVRDANFNLSGTSSSGLTVSYSSSNTAVATVSGNTVTIVGAGTTIITASQPGNANYNAATPVSQALTINKTSQTITFNVLANKVVGDADFALTATASSGLAVSYLSSNPLVATVSGNTVTIVGTGTTVIAASQPGNGNYYAAATVSQSLTVTAGSKTDQTITFAALPDKIFGDDNFMLAATTSSGLPVSYLSSNESVATISDNAVTIVGAGITVITASQPGNASYNAAIEVSRTLTINKRDQTISFSSLADKTVGDMAFSLTATASSGLAVTYSAASDRVTITGTSVDVVKPGRATIIASQGGNAGYNQANSVSQSFCIKPAKPTITITNGDTGSPVLTSSAHEGNQWFLNDAVIPGATNATWHAVQPGVYKVQVKVDDCVSDFSADQPLIVTGIAENHDDNMKVELYPNPATDWLHVSLGSLPGRKDITIFQMNGLETVSRQVDGQEARFSLIDYPKGMYVVKVKSGNRMRLIRFVKF